MPAKAKRLRIVAGPNGSGKSNIIEQLRKTFDCGVYLNTDDIEKILSDKGLLIPFCYRAYLFDNSSETKLFIQAAEIYRGVELISHTDSVPKWIYTYVIDPLNLS